MRSRPTWLSLLRLLLFAISAGVISAAGQACTGLCLQQTSCPNGGTTTLTGVVYAPNGTDPLPGVLVYIPNAAVSAFPAGVTCAVAGQPPSGSPLVGTTTAVDGTFMLTNVPVGADIPLVVQSGRWRRQVTVPATAACASTSFSTRFPQTQSEGDIPKIAVVTGAFDAVECVLRKVGLTDAEFTDPTGTGRINLFLADGAPGGQVDTATPAGATLLSDPTALSAYDVLMLPCEGAAFLKAPDQLGNLVGYANAGGRVYASHYSYDWLYQNPPFNTVVNWVPDQREPPDGTATVDTSFAQGQVLSGWLQTINATATAGQIPITTVRHDLGSVNPPTQTWLTLNNAAFGNPVMQFTFNTPISTTAQACGRVLFNEYHVENPAGATSNVNFPAECVPGAMTAQEKLLEFSLFDLTGDGGPPTLTPLSDSFGTEPVGSTTSAHKYLWTNNTLFPVTVSGATITGDFALTGNTCGTVNVGASCELDADFAPSTIGARTGSLTVVSNTGTLTAALTGSGITPLAVSAATLSFGKVDVGASVAQTVTITNVTGYTIALPALTATGDFATTTGCGATLPASSSCAVTVTFTPTTTGGRTGTLNIGATAVPSAGLPGTSSLPALQTTLAGTGVDFSVALGPVSAQAVAGAALSTSSTTSPIAGFDNPVTVSCTTTAPASTCTLASGGFTPENPVTDAVSITTTAQYTVLGYGSFGSFTGPAGGVRSRLFSFAGALLALFSALGLLRKRRSVSRLAEAGRLIALLLCTAALSTALTGCTGKDPAQNTPYTPAGSYTYTVAVTDGFLKHSATYNVMVSSK